MSQLEAMLNEVDLTHSGRISLGEFKDAIRGHMGFTDEDEIPKTVFDKLADTASEPSEAKSKPSDPKKKASLAFRDANRLDEP